MEQPNLTSTDAGSKIEGASESTSQLESAALKHPFKRIALALSGGGFRAASFSIGTMSYLAQIKNNLAETDEGTLLDNVEFISSASGGTFAGMLYAARVKRGMRFDEIYHELISFMQGESLLKQVLQNINDETQWTASDKNRNFINAFSKIYDRALFKGEKFGVYSLEDTVPRRRNIEVCFNATEFYRGLSFRFQAGKHGSNMEEEGGKTGNRYIFFDNSSETSLRVLRDIKLGDILAASSCFPAGFEPMVYPEDFSYAAAGTAKALQTDELRRAMLITDYDGKEQVLNTSIGLMDGGIDDNQGLYSAILADKRRRNHNPDNGFDLIMVTDVASYFMDPYIPPGRVPDSTLPVKTFGAIFKQFFDIYGNLSSALKWISILSSFLLIASIFIVIFAEQDTWSNIGFLLLSPSILVLLLLVFLIGFRAGNTFIKTIVGWLGASDRELVVKIKSSLPAISNFSNDAVKLLTHYLKYSPIPVLERMVSTRVNSMLSLVLDINLKHTRRLIFDIFYGNFYGNNIWENRRVFNVIYELSSFNRVSRAMTLKKKFRASRYNPVPDDWSNQCTKLLSENCREINSIAENARTMGTTLWYEAADANRMKAIIACGQFTACCKMLEYAMVTARVIDIESVLPNEKKTIRLNAAEMDLFVQTKKTLESDWRRFTADPFYLYDIYEKTKGADQ